MAGIITCWIEIYNRAVRLRINLVEGLLQQTDSVQTGDVVVKTKDIWDALTVPGVNTVWSAPASLLEARFRIVRWLGLPYLIFLKIVSLMVYFGLPALAVVLLARSIFRLFQRSVLMRCSA